VKRRAFLALPWLAAATASRAQTFEPVVPGVPLAFPRDYGSHPTFRTEWWYITGWVRGRDGQELGVQVTFFRNRPAVAERSASAFAARQLVFAHAAIAEAAHGRLRHGERVARAAFDLAGASEGRTHAWIGDWSLEQQEERYVATLASREFALALVFTPTQPVLLQGDGGYSRKGPRVEHASRYYSIPQLAVSGRIIVGGTPHEVQGRAWLDHEWSSEYLAPGAIGWDWVGANLDDGGAFMAFRIRDARGEALWSGGAVRAPGTTDRSLAPEAVRFRPTRSWTSPRTSARYPVQFDVDVDGVVYTLMPLMDDQELDSRWSTGTVYWEGAVRVLREGRDVGRGYLELTGYAGALRI
jgi:predicted secreted hydrolase